MAKFKNIKFVQEVTGQDKATIAAAETELRGKLAAKFPMTLSVGKGKEKVSITIDLIQ